MPVQLQARPHRPDTRIGEVVGAVLGMAISEALWDQLLDRVSDQFVSRVTEQPLRLRIDANDLSFVVDDDDRNRPDCG